MGISAKLVKELRERTGEGMMECKKFLEKVGGDIEAAIDEMRKSGAAKAAKKSGRITAEGLVAIRVSEDRKSAVILEVNCETDFVSRGDDFKGFVDHCTEHALANQCKDVASLAALSVDGGTIESARQDMTGKVGENINLRRVSFVEAKGKISSYVHGVKIGVIIDADSSDDDLGKDLAMHIAASSPLVVSGDDVPAEMIAKEKEIYTAQAAESGKPADIIEKMVVGRVRKYLEEVSLHGQAFVKDPNTKVSDLLKQRGATVHSFIRFEVGEGIEKRQENFADEVMAQVRGNKD